MLAITTMLALQKKKKKKKKRLLDRTIAKMIVVTDRIVFSICEPTFLKLAVKMPTTQLKCTLYSRHLHGKDVKIGNDEKK